jgi:uncharacterized membrane protein YfcA
LLVEQLVQTAFFESALRISLGAVLLSVGVAGVLAKMLHISIPEKSRGGVMLLAAAGAGAAVATTSAGSGTLLAALVFPVTKWSVRELSAVSNVFGLVTGLIGIAAYAHLDGFDPQLLGPVIAGAVTGIVVGVFASRRIQTRHFSVAVVILTIALGLGLIFY